MIKRQPADDARDDPRGGEAANECQYGGQRREAVMLECQTGRIGTNAEKCRLAEGQYAGITPQQIDGERDSGEQKGTNQVVDQKGG